MCLTEEGRPTCLFSRRNLYETLDPVPSTAGVRVGGGIQPKGGLRGMGWPNRRENCWEMKVWGKNPSVQLARPPQRLETGEAFANP